MQFCGVNGLNRGLPANISKELQALVLMTPYDGSSNSVALSARELFVKHLKAQTNVHDTFFAGVDSDPNETKITNSSKFDFEGFAAAYVCAAIGEVSQYGFGGTVDEQKCLDYMKERMTSDSWITLSLELYTLLFSQQVKYDSYDFQYFLNSDRDSWGKQLLDTVTSTDFINTHASAAIHNEWPDMEQQFNIILFKLYHLGGQSMVDAVVKEWTNSFDNKITVNWNTYDYLDGSKPIDISSIDGDIKSAIAVKRTDKESVYSPTSIGPSAVSNTRYKYTYGIAVVSFVSDWAQRIGVATGTKPNNVTYEYPSPYSCFLAGTRVITSNTESINIEDVTEGVKILSHGGTISTQSSERVTNLVPSKEKIYGFNEEDAFFSGGHAFWTTEGWKAVAPELAREENPDLAIGTLQVGDIVFRVAQSKPLLYKPVVIHTLRSRDLDVDTIMYGLHLTGYKSYHANGYVVIMNYPQLTQKRLRDGMSKLNSVEKVRLVTAVNSVLPELSKCLGGFIPPALGNTGFLPADEVNDTA